MDFIFNHTSNEHEWARKAVAGDPGYEDFYLIFPDRTMPDAYEKTVREIFPDDHPGSFVQLADGRWIWATFYHFQWDLNYANPAVFRAMAGEMLFLANQGVEVLRMDAVAFIWKRLGTASESLPEAHLLLRAFNAVLRMAAPEPALQVGGDRAPRRGDRVRLARGVPALLQPAADGAHLGGPRHPRPADAAAGAGAPARPAAPAPHGSTTSAATTTSGGRSPTRMPRSSASRGTPHRRFLNDFYVGRFPGTFARGVPFQENPKTGDARVTGTTASLAGVEAGDAGGVDRMLLAHAIAMSTGGVPLLYLGDEVAQLNDYSYADDPATAATAAGCTARRGLPSVTRSGRMPHGCRTRVRRADRAGPHAEGDARVRRRGADRLRRASIRRCSATSGRGRMP